MATLPAMWAHGKLRFDWLDGTIENSTKTDSCCEHMSNHFEKVNLRIPIRIHILSSGAYWGKWKVREQATSRIVGANLLKKALNVSRGRKHPYYLPCPYPKLRRMQINRRNAANILTVPKSTHCLWIVREGIQFYTVTSLSSFEGLRMSNCLLFSTMGDNHTMLGIVLVRCQLHIKTSPRYGYTHKPVKHDYQNNDKRYSNLMRLKVVKRNDYSQIKMDIVPIVWHYCSYPFLYLPHIYTHLQDSQVYLSKTPNWQGQVTSSNTPSLAYALLYQFSWSLTSS